MRGGKRGGEKRGGERRELEGGEEEVRRGGEKERGEEWRRGWEEMIYNSIQYKYINIYDLLTAHP